MGDRRERRLVRGPLPGWVGRIVALLVDPSRRDDVTGDLQDTFQRRRDTIGRARALGWLGVEVTGLLLWRVRVRWGPAMACAVADFGRDMRGATRSLGLRPGFTATAVVVLGIGIGAPTIVLTMVNRIYFERPALVEHPDRLVRLYRAWTDGTAGGSLGHPDFVYYREGAGLLSGLAAWSGPSSVAWSTAEDHRDQLDIRFVSPEFFEVLGVPLLLGRAFDDQEGRVIGQGASIVLSEGFWRRALGADPQIVGRTVRLNGAALTVIGVAPEEFHGVSPVDAPTDGWVPISLYGTIHRLAGTAWWERLPDESDNWLSVVGRVANGVTIETAEAQLLALHDRLAYEGKQETEFLLVARQVLYTPNTSRALGSLMRILLMLVGVVLLIAIANVAVLLLSFASTRGWELGLRAALGAGRGRLTRQLLAETCVLGVLGGLLGIGLAALGGDRAGSFLPYRFAGSFAPDPGVLAAAVALSLLTALAVGVVPAVRSSRVDVVSAIGDARSPGGRSRLRDALVVGQVTLSVVLVSAALLFARSFAAASGEDLGFETDRRLLVSVDLRSAGLSAEEGLLFLDEARRRVEQVPGVEAVSTTRQTPFGGDWSTDFTPPPDRYPDAPAGPVFLGMNAVSPGYFSIMGVPIVEGRALDERDGAGAPPAGVINQTLARTLWPNGGAVGQLLALGGDRDVRVVGVARDAQYYELGEEPVAQAYFSVDQFYQSRVTFVVASAGPDPSVLADAVEATMRDLQPNLAFRPATTMAAVFEQETARYRVTATLVGLFGAVALVLAATGLYGVISFMVTARTREIGVRMALGARRRRVAAQVVRHALARAAVGVIAGLIAFLWARRFAESLVFSVDTLDPFALVGGGGILLVVATIAALGPARRATRIDPLDAMQAD